jgi:hypothetical protein
MQGSQSLDPYLCSSFPIFIACWIVTAASILHWNTQLSTCVSMTQDAICIFIPKDDILFSLSPESLCNLKQSFIGHSDTSVRYTSFQLTQPLSTACDQKASKSSLLAGNSQVLCDYSVCRMHKTNMIAAVQILLDIWGQLLNDPSPHVRVDTHPLRALPPDVTRITCRQFSKENGTQKSWCFIQLLSPFSTKILYKFRICPTQSSCPLRFILFHFIAIRQFGKE